ncbi:hypothetical protein BH09MYX1_BH09MYX1_36350 [soil metagenome]
MFKTTTRDDALETLALHDSDAESTLILAPARGGMATRWTIRDREIFYLDEGTLRDPSKNVRGGNPVLFPQPGKLEGDVYSRDGKRGSLKQHGFARNLPWTVVGTSTADAASAVLRLTSNEMTRSVFPWDFVAEYTYSLRGAALRIEQRFSNTGAEPMPFGAGFHPYFHVKQSEKRSARVSTTATRAFDNVTKKTGPLSIDLGAPETDLHLVDHGKKPCTLAWPSGTITVSASEEFTHWVLWTIEGKDFVCVEPWTCPGNALNTGDRLLVLPPGETRALWIEIAVEIAGEIAES